MLKNSLFVLLVMFVCPLIALSLEDDFLGTYALSLSRSANTGYQKHSINIKNFTKKSVKGEISLDFNIGPQARMPMDWERLHTIPFEGTFDSQTNKISFSVNVPLGKDIRYFFYGYLLYGDSKSIVGIYRVGDEKYEGGFLAIMPQKSK